MSDHDAATPPAGVRVGWGLVRLITAFGLTAAIVAQLMTTMAMASDKGRDLTTTLVNFFSFFTILSNCLGAIILLVGGLWLLIRGPRRQWEPRWMSFAFISIGTYMVTTGIVYNLLLRGYTLEQGATVPWSNEVLHLIGPLIFLVDLILRIARRPLPWTAMGVATLFPLAWVAYTMWRGANVVSPVTGAGHWYPYPFLDPYVTYNGYIGVGVYAIGIAVAIMLLAALGVWRTRMGSHNATRSASASPAAAPVVAEPVLEDSAVEEPVAEELIFDEPVAEDPVVEGPLVEEPVVEDPVVAVEEADEDATGEPSVVDAPEVPELKVINEPSGSKAAGGS